MKTLSNHFSILSNKYIIHLIKYDDPIKQAQILQHSDTPILLQTPSVRLRLDSDSSPFKNIRALHERPEHLHPAPYSQVSRL